MQRLLLALFVGLTPVLAAAPCEAVPAFVQATTLTSEDGSDDGVSCPAYGSNVTAGNLLVAFFVWHNGSGQTINTPTDSLSNTWNLVGSSLDQGVWRTRVAYAMNSAGGANTVSVTFSAATTFKLAACFEYSGIATSSALVTSASNAQTDPGTGANAVTSTNVTTTANNQLAVGCTLMNTTNTIGVGTDYTERIDSSGAFASVQCEDNIVETAGTEDATWTSPDASADFASHIAIFAEPAGGAAVVRGPLLGVGP